MKKSSQVYFVNILLIMLLGYAAPIEAQTTSVTGQILPGKNYPLELWVYDLESNKYKLGKKLTLTKEGEFDFEIPKEPNLYKLWLSGNGLVFVNDGDENIRIDIDMKNAASPFKIGGSQASNHLLDYLTTVGELQAKYLAPLEPKMEAALKSKDQAQIEAVEMEHKENLKLFVQTLDQQITSMGSSLGVYAIIRTLDFNKYLPNIENWGKTYERERPDFPFTKRLQKMIADAKKIQVGSIAPEFELATQTNETKKLSDFRGGLVLIDFWASWCLPCRKENAVFKEVYAEFKGKRFKIWGISTDEKEKNWEKALKKDELPWEQSRSSGTEVEKLYHVVSLPTNFLIDQDGKIVAKNISAKELAEILKEMGLKSKAR